MARFMYEAVLHPGEEGGYDVSIPDLEGCYTYGDTVEEAVEMAADAMSLYVASVMYDGEAIPKATFGHVGEGCKVVVVSFEASPDDIIEGAVVSATEAAKVLGVSRSRVSHMIRDGILDAYREGRSTYVTQDSIDRRLAIAR